MNNQNSVSFRKFKPGLLALAISTVVVAPVSADLVDDTLAHIDVDQMESGEILTGFDVVKLPDNQFAIVWAIQNDGASDKILLQRYSQQGVSVGNQVVVYEHATAESGRLMRPVIAADKTGNMVIGWDLLPNIQKTGRECLYAQEIMAVRLNPSDSIQALNFDGVDLTNACGIQVAMDEDGDFAVSWGLRNGNSNVDGRVMTFNTLGTAQSNEIELGSSALYAPSLAMQSDGRFLAAWPKTTSGTTYVFARRFADINGTTSGSVFRLDNDSDREFTRQLKSDLAADAEGGFVAIWGEHPDTVSATGSFRSINFRGQRWMADGSAGNTLDFGQVSPIVDSRTQYYSKPSISADADGDVVATWSHDVNIGDNYLVEGYKNQLSFLASDDTESTYGPFEIGEEGEFVTFVLGNGAQVSMTENAAAAVWTEDNNYLSDTVTLQARFFTTPEKTAEPDDSSLGDDSSSGGSTGWLMIVVLSLLSSCRFFGQRLFRKFIDRTDS